MTEQKRRESFRPLTAEERERIMHAIRSFMRDDDRDPDEVIAAQYGGDEDRYLRAMAREHRIPLGSYALLRNQEGKRVRVTIGGEKHSHKPAEGAASTEPIVPLELTLRLVRVYGGPHNLHALEGVEESTGRRWVIPFEGRGSGIVISDRHRFDVAYWILSISDARGVIWEQGAGTAVSEDLGHAAPATHGPFEHSNLAAAYDADPYKFLREPLRPIL